MSKKKGSPYRTTIIRLTEETHYLMSEAAHERETSLAALVREAVREYMSAHGIKEVS